MSNGLQSQSTDAFVKKVVELIEYIVFTVGSFCVGALQIAGVVDVYLANFLIFLLAFAVVLRFALHEWLSSKSWQRVIKTTIGASLIVGIVFFITYRLVDSYKTRQSQERAEQERLFIEQRDRLEFQTVAESKLKYLALRFELNRLYSVTELDQYRVFLRITNGTKLSDIGAACQQEYDIEGRLQIITHAWLFSEGVAINKKDANGEQLYPIRINPTDYYTTKKEVSCTFFDINGRPFNQTVNDLNLNLVGISLSSSFVEKVSNVSFIANNFELFSYDISQLDINEEKDNYDEWFTDLVGEKKKTHWKRIDRKALGVSEYDKAIIESNAVNSLPETFSINFLEIPPKRSQFQAVGKKPFF